MTNLFSSVLVVGFSFCVIGAEEMPISNPNRSSLVIQVADGCGFNKYRDARGICRRKYIIGGRYEKNPFTERAEGRTHTVCAICTGSAGWSVIEPPAHST